MPLTEEEKRERNRAACRRYYERNKEKAAERNRRWHEENRNKKREYNRAWRESNPEKVAEQKRRSYWSDPEKAKGRHRLYYIENRENIHERVRQYQLENKEAHKEWQKRWAKRNPGKILAASHRRIARKKNAALALFPVTPEVIAERLALTDGCCYCGSDAPKELEHVVALNDGGWHIPSNLLGACRSCNSSKNDRPVEEWFRAQPFFNEQRWQLIQELTNG